MFDAEQSRRIGAAIRTAETRTDGEIMVIAARASDAYHDVALHWAIVAMLLAFAMIATFPDFYTGLIGGWQAEWTARGLMTLALVVGVVKFLAVRLILAWQPLRILLTPRATRARRVRRRAIEMFRAGIEKRTASRTGVLLYISLGEHRAEIIADAAVHGRVPEARWGEAMAALVDGLRDNRATDGVVEAVTRIGDVLAEALPHSGRDPDELPDRIIEL